MTRHSYAGGANAIALTAPIDAVSNTGPCTAIANWPDFTVGPFIVTINRGQPNEEKCLVAEYATNLLTFAQRGYDGTTAVAHSAGEPIEHTIGAWDVDTANQHDNAQTGVHGLPASDHVVGTATTQTLTGKTMSGSDNSFSNIPQSAVTNLPTDLAAKATTAALTAETNARTQADLALDGRITSEADTRAAWDSGHLAAGDPHPQYLTQGEGDARYDAIGAATSGDAAHVAAADPHPVYMTNAEEASLNRVTGSAPGVKIASGQVTIPVAAGIAAGGGSAQVAITFPVGLFTAPPNVVISQNSAPNGSQQMVPRTIGATAAAANALAYNCGAAATIAHTITAAWVAVGV
jgi:hypothetical protein